MVDRPTKLAGSLMIATDANSKEINISLDIPVQTIYLRGYRAEMTDAATALSTKILYVDIPNVFNSNKLIDSNPSHTYLPIFLDNAAVSLQTGLEIAIPLSHHIPKTFKMRVLDSNFAPVSGLVHLALRFELELGRL